MYFQLQVEREWRRKEREEAMKKRIEEEKLFAARSKQIEDQKRAYAFEIQKEKEETEKIVKLNLENIEKSKEMEYKNKMVSIYCTMRLRRLIKKKNSRINKPSIKIMRI